MININIERPGFSIKVGEIELWFDMSLEKQERMPTIQKDFHNQMKFIEAETSKLLKEVEESDGSNQEEINKKALEAYKKVLEIAFDEIFDEGTFNKLYGVYPYVESLTDVYVSISENIGIQIEKYNKKRVNEFENKKNKYLKKKNKKK